MTKEEIQQYLWNFLRNKGLPEKSTAAIMGNVYGESGFNPDAVEGGTGIGFGLCQWSYDRKRQLFAYGTSLSHQFYFLWYELTGENTSVADFQYLNKSGYVTYDDFMEGNGTIEELTKGFCFCWERPNFEQSHIDVRIEKALEYYDMYKGSGGGEEPEPEPEPDPEEPLPTAGEVYEDIKKTPYNFNQLTEDEMSEIKKWSYGDKVKIKFTFNRRKGEIGTTFTGKQLTIDDKEYTIKSVKNNGFVCIAYDGSLCYKYVNPKLLSLSSIINSDETETEGSETA